MNTTCRYITIVLIALICIQSATVTTSSYPSYVNQARAFLRCHMSAIACKRSLSIFKEDPDPEMIKNKNDLETCLSEDKPLWYCLKHNPAITLEDMNQN
ncbi:unnamed protein product [Adineta ricciae]|uniref:Uncharacterized protein n=1 Tax=Adineta ricciae TaxID=249248 RepID=A0A813X411_ADIRI|nr:unnamed protein product [Adineta ricciae]